MRKGKYFKIKQFKIRNSYTAWASVVDPDPNPDPLVRGMDPEPDPSTIKQK